MNSFNEGTVLVTGACGYIGRKVCATLRDRRIKILPVDVSGDREDEFFSCDLRRPDQVSELFTAHGIRTVVHLAGVLPSAFLSDPLQGAEVNLAGSIHLLREAANHGSKRFVFASSMSVYGSSQAAQPLSEDDPAKPDEPYGASPSKQDLICIPYGPDALLSLAHVEDVARMFATLVTTERLASTTYNIPAEIWRVGELREAIQTNLGVSVELINNGADGGPLADGARFAQEFGFQLRGLRSRIAK